MRANEIQIGNRVGFPVRFRRIVNVQSNLANRIYSIGQDLYRLALIDRKQPNAHREELIEIGNRIIRLQRQSLIWNKFASAFRDSPSFIATDAPFAEAEFLHEMIKLTAAIEHMRENTKFMALEHRFLQQKCEDIEAFNVAINSWIVTKRSFWIALVAIAVSVLFEISSALGSVTAIPEWWAIGGIGWGLGAGIIAAHYWYGIWP